MKTIVNISGRVNDTVELDVPSTVFSEPDTSILYNIIADRYPNSNWEDICCVDVQYRDDYIECKVITK